MTREEFKAMTQSGIVLLDGATGTNLRAAGMPVGVCPEMWVLDHPEPLQTLQRDYAAAGSAILYAPTFGANRVSLALYGLENRVGELNRRLVGLSRDAVGGRAYVAGDITTTGRRVDAEGGIGYAELMDVYREQAEVQLEAGVDLFAVETMMGIAESCAAIEAIRALTDDVPILCTLSLDAVGNAYFDGSADDVAVQLPALGADAVGVNCGQGPDLLEDVVRRMAGQCALPLIVKPNAGLPQMQPDGSALYSMSPGRFARSMTALTRAGAGILGGCCGTTPEYIRALAAQCYLNVSCRG